MSAASQQADPPEEAAAREAVERGGNATAAQGRPKQGQPPRGAATREAVEGGSNATAAQGRPKQGQPPRGAATREAVERGGNATQPRNPLHGVTLEAMVTALVAHHGWGGLGERIPVRCFNVYPSVTSSLRFLRKTPWAREKVEGLYLATLRAQRRASPRG